MATQVNFSTILVYMFLEYIFVFMCRVLSVLVCIVHSAELKNLALTKEILDSNET